MHRTLVLIFCTILPATAQPASSLKAVLLEQLRTTHNQKEWFVPVNIALEGLSPEQARWQDGSGNHSIGQLANHLLFWNQQQLSKFQGQKVAGGNVNNDETFNNFDVKNWKETVSNLDKVLTDLETVVQNADDTKLKSWASAIAHIGTHNAYHTGQIVYIRKLKGAWDPAKGVR